MTTVMSTAIMTVLVFDDGEVDGCEKGERLGWPVGGSIGENISVIVIKGNFMSTNVQLQVARVSCS